MIQSHESLKKNAIIVDSYCPFQIQKIYSSSFAVFFNIKKKSEHPVACLGRGSHYEGLFFEKIFPPIALRRKDAFLEYLRKYLLSVFVLAIKIDTKDRILSLTYGKWGHKNFLLFFWKGRDLYFLNYYFDQAVNNFILFKSWSLDVESDNRQLEKLSDLEREEYLFCLFDLLGRRQLEIKLSGQKERSILDEEIKKASQLENPKKDLLKINNITKDLQALQDLDVWEQDLKKTENILGDHFFLGKWNVKFHSGWSHEHKKSVVFEKLKQLKKGKKILLKRLEEVQYKVQKNEPMLVFQKQKIISSYWKYEKIQKSVADVDVDFYHFKNKSLAIGKNAQANHWIRTKWASKQDYWLHLDKITGSHLVIKIKNILDLTDEDFDMISSLLLWYSGFKDIKDGFKINVVFTTIRDLKGVKGSSGKVIFRKAQYRLGNYRSIWSTHILRV